ncbi:AgmX/PglI C-terminal domain-containing protein [Vulgatibacter sp.]|uniref:AgmX/PglI C-terminal domain-containing protein n=1 Tax=Vulgatibacter sp. TaxID=1971226 RepID=UPI003563E49E
MRLRLLAILLGLAAPFSAAAQQPATPPAPAPAPAKKPDVRDQPFSREAVLAVVSSHRDQIQKCYEDAMAQRGATGKSAPKGRVVIAWSITEEGLAAEVRVKRTEIKDELVTDCMVEAIRFWEFPRPKARQPVEFPFDLQPSSAPAGGKKDRN